MAAHQSDLDDLRKSLDGVVAEIVKISNSPVFHLDARVQALEQITNARLGVMQDVMDARLDTMQQTTSAQFNKMVEFTNQQFLRLYVSDPVPGDTVDDY